MKLMSAIGMLTVSAAMLVSSTFAWFSLNKTVTAGTMTIEAKSDSPYLLISEDTTDANFATSITFDSSATDANALMLTTPLNVASNVAYKATEAATSTTTPSKFTQASDVLWGTTFSTDPAQVQASNVTTLIAATDLNKYVLTKEMYVKVKANTVDGTNFKLSAATFTGGTNTIKNAARLLIVTESGTYMMYNARTGAITGDSALLATLSTSATKLTAYFFFDGTDADAYTNLASDLSDVSISMEFTIDNDTAVG
jgi:hypothetical protein